MEVVKGKILSSTPSHPRVKKFFQEVKSPSDIGSPLVQPKNIIKKSTILDMVIDAIIAVGEPKKGASYQAIRKWILGNKDVDSSRLKHSLKLALQKGISTGVLLRPRKSENAVGVIGSFKLALQKPLKSSKKTVNKSPKDKTSTILTKANKASSSKTDGKIAKSVSPGKGTQFATKTSKKSPSIKEASKKAADKNPTTKSSKAKNKTDDAAVSKAKAEKKPNSNAVLKEKTEKKINYKGVAKRKGVQKPLTNGRTKAKGIKEDTLQKLKEDAVFFSDSQSDEDPEKVEMMALKGKTGAKNIVKKEELKNKTEKSKLIKAEDAPSTKDKNGKIGKTQKRTKPDGTSSDQTLNKGKRIAKTAVNKKVTASEKELERQDFSDSEVAVKKRHLKVLKSFSSDTELEVSKMAERRAKKATRVRKNISKAY